MPNSSDSWQDPLTAGLGGGQPSPQPLAELSPGLGSPQLLALLFLEAFVPVGVCSLACVQAFAGGTVGPAASL